MTAPEAGRDRAVRLPPRRFSFVGRTADLAEVAARLGRYPVVTHGSVLAGIGLAVGVPLGIVLGRGLWRVVAEFTPLAYRPPLAILVLLLIGPVTVLAANLLAVWPGQRAAGLRPAQVLHTE